jgi:hypothetical protein
MIPPFYASIGLVSGIEQKSRIIRPTINAWSKEQSRTRRYWQD